ncbi:hypothetical protein BCR35DRAFT_310680 [Leucosporidium creatinivorum]|nr:hypothetical protein BCR35DRAFT_310680 [Leucosporidium creatinivorum]
MSSETVVKGDKVIEKVDGKVVSSKDYAHVLAGYRATLSRAGVSNEAREHAETMIKELEASHAKSIGAEATKEHHDAHHVRVVAGLKAALKNEHVHDEKKEEIRQRLDEMGEPYDA